MAFEREEKRHISVSKVETDIYRRILNEFPQIAQARLFLLHFSPSNPKPVISPIKQFLCTDVEMVIKKALPLDVN